jgi:hypothetical protein
MKPLFLLRNTIVKPNILLGFWALCLLCVPFAPLYSQVVQSVGTAKAADVAVFITDNIKAADLYVYRVDYKKESKGNKGRWYFQDALTYADVKVFFTGSAKEAQLLIYFVDAPEQAKWINRKKKHLLE